MTEWNSESVTDWKICWFSQKPQKWLSPQEAVQRNDNQRRPCSSSVFIVLDCMTNSGVCVSFCWNVLKVCSLSFLSVSPGTHKKSICKLNCSTRCLWKRRASRCVCCQWTCTRSSFFEIQKKQLNESAFYMAALWFSANSFKVFMVKTNKIP